MGTSFRHDAALYRGDREFLALALPFLRGGLAAGEPTILRVAEHRAAVVRDALDDPPELTVLPPLGGGHPFSVLHADHDRFASLLDGAPLVRLLSETPAESATWDDWGPWEAAGQLVHAAQRVWRICPFDTGTTAAHVLDDVARTHPRLHTPDGERESPVVADAAAFLAERASVRDPLEDGEPVVDLVDPAPLATRTALAALDAPSGLVYAVSEAVTNANDHGVPPCRVRVWTAPDRMVATVHDAGPGPADPCAGLVPTRRRDLHAGMGLWMAHRMCDRVALDTSGPGFTVRLTARR